MVNGEANSGWQNGAGAFILQCKRIELTYCDRWGSSRGMKWAPLPLDLKRTEIAIFRAFLTSPFFAHFAKAHPQILIDVSRHGNSHPSIRAEYINGRSSDVCVRNLKKEQILKKVEQVSRCSGQKEKKITGGRMVESLNESTRGIWDELHQATGRDQGLLEQRVTRVSRGLIGEKRSQRWDPKADNENSL